MQTVPVPWTEQKAASILGGLRSGVYAAAMPSPDEDAAGDPIPARRVADDKKATEHLANERTFLAWVRTAIAVISLGFVVAKFGLWLERIPGAASTASGHEGTGWSTPLGSAMMAAGATLCLLAAWHHRRTSRAIERGQVVPATGLVTFVGGLVAFLAAVMIVYLALGARR